MKKPEPSDSRIPSSPDAPKLCMPGGGKSHALEKLIVHMPGPSVGFVQGLMQKIAVKTGLIALFSFSGAQVRKNVTRQVITIPGEAEVLGLYRDIATHPADAPDVERRLRELDSPMRWPMRYAAEYYLGNLAAVKPATWEKFVDGVVLFEGKGLPDEAAPLLLQAVDEGFLPAFAILGDYCLKRRKIDLAIETVKPASQAGYAPAMHQHGYYINVQSMGKMFQYRRLREVWRLYSAAAEAGYPPSMAVVGEMYFNGFGAAVPRDLYRSLDYLERAFQAGEDRCLPLLRRVRAAAGV